MMTQNTLKISVNPPKLTKELSHSNSVRSNSPSPKKIHIEKKVNIKSEIKSVEGNKKEENKTEVNMEQSERVGKDKVDAATQLESSELEDISLNQRVRAGLMTQLEVNLRLAREEIEHMKQEKKQLKAHKTWKHAGYETQYEELLLEKEKISIEVLKLQSEKDVLLAKVTVTVTVDECIKDMRCDGDCEHTGCNADQVQRLRNMKNQGGRRCNPTEQASPSPWIHCPQCNFTSRQESEVKNHVRREHEQKPSCPFCLLGFTSQVTLKSHIEEYHSENTHINREQIVTNRQSVQKKGACIFFLRPRGCKKGSQCDFSHNRDVQYSLVKVRKLCRNGPVCVWKPRCRYVHLEDGDIIPPRVLREDTRAPRREARGSREEGRTTQGFGTQELNQPPQGYNMGNYPGLRPAQNPDYFRPWGNQ